jgi:ketosteroid isomerase-like protein
MSRENVEIVRKAYDAFNESGVDALLEYFHPDLEYDVTAGDGPFAGMYHGHAAVRNFLTDYLDSWEYARMEAADVAEVGEDHVLVLLRMSLRGKGSGVEVSAETFNTWTMRDGKAARVAIHNERAEALEAVASS